MAYGYLPEEEAKKRRRAYYLKNRSKVVRQVRGRKNRLKLWIQEQKARPCSDCRMRYPTYVMDFDHRPGTGKVMNVGLLYRLGSRKLAEAEIAKCDVVCSNCHRIRTHERLGAKTEPEALPLAA